MPVYRRGPGLVGTAARTAVFMGTANAVNRRQQQRWAKKDAEQAQQQNPQQAQPQQAAPAPEQSAHQEPAAAPAAGGHDDVIAKLEKLADMKASGLLTDDEYKSAKARLLG